MAEFKPLNLAQLYQGADAGVAQAMQMNMFALKMGEMKADHDERVTIKDLARNHDISTPAGLEGYINDVARVSPVKAMGLRKTLAEQQKATAELVNSDQTSMINFAKDSKDILPTIQDERGWQSWRQTQLARAQALVTPQMRNIALEQVKALPEQFDPEWVKRRVVDVNKLFEPKPEKVDIGGHIDFVDTNPFTNPSIVGKRFTRTQSPADVEAARHNRATEDNTRRGQDQVDQRARDANKIAEGKTVNEATTALRKEFNDLPEVKNYRSVVPVIESAKNAPDTRAGDIQLAYTVGKAFDPTSVVREGELKLTGEAATAMEKFKGELRTVVMGKGRLTPETRRELMETLQTRVDALKESHDASRTVYQRVATERRLPADQIFIEPPTTPAAKPKTAAAAPGALPPPPPGFKVDAP